MCDKSPHTLQATPSLIPDVASPIMVGCAGTWHNGKERDAQQFSSQDPSTFFKQCAYGCTEKPNYLVHIIPCTLIL